jgi:hypothetical protein
MRRRDFLKSSLALQLSALPILGSRPKAKSAILLLLTGGPSHLDTWDMKPDAPSHIRGPFRPIRTNVPGIEISEIFPRMARHADKYALIRSVHHDGPAIHETGLQQIQSGLFANSAIVPCALGNTGCDMPNGQSLNRRIIAGDLSDFEQNCRTAARLAASGVPAITVNMFDTVFGKTTWDAHGSKPFSTLSDYRTHVGPAFDNGFSTLLEDLSARGTLDSTLVIAAGEFGRSPRINPAGGRDHWPQCWTVLMAGGGIQGGQIYGSSDATGAEPRENPVTPAMLSATVRQALSPAL